jgi:hypothetical protein
MSVGIKNCVEILGAIYNDVDFAISEECVQYLNCTAYANFTTRGTEVGKPVFEVEYVNYTVSPHDPNKSNMFSDLTSSPLQYSGGWSDDGVALNPTQFKTKNIAFPELTGEKLRRKLCNLDEPGVTLDNPYLKINTIIKTLDLDGFIMFCDGRVEKTRTKDVEQQHGPNKKSRRSWSRELIWRRMGGRPFDP